MQVSFVTPSNQRHQAWITLANNHYVAAVCHRCLVIMGPVFGIVQLLQLVLCLIILASLLAILQEQLDTLKAESARADGQLQEAKAKLAAAEKDLNASRQSAYEDAQAANKEKQEMHNAITNLQVSMQALRNLPSCHVYQPHCSILLRLLVPEGHLVT